MLGADVVTQGTGGQRISPVVCAVAGHCLRPVDAQRQCGSARGGGARTIGPISSSYAGNGGDLGLLELATISSAHEGQRSLRKLSAERRQKLCPLRSSRLADGP